MPDRDREAQADRNRRTLLVARGPDGFPARVKAAAAARGMSVSAFVVASLEPQLPPPGAGKTGDCPAPGASGASAELNTGTGSLR